MGEFWRVAIIVGGFSAAMTAVLWLGLNYVAGAW
jgi:hypothetical protein